MFDIGWSELLIIAVMALIVVGPKDLPVLLRAIGRYVGIIRRQASEFRAQFDEALRESEFDQIRKDVAGIKQDVASTVHEAGRHIEQDLDTVAKDASVKEALEDKKGAKSESGNGAEVEPGEDDSSDDWRPAAETESPVSKPETPDEEPASQTSGSVEKSGV